MSLHAKLSAVLVLDARADLGEGPLWDPVTRRLLWVDVISSLVHTFDPHTGLDTVCDVGAHVGAVVMRTNGGLILAQRHGFTRLDPGAASPVTVAEPADHPATNRFNDGKCDPAGRFWAGTMAYDGATGAGSLYRLDPDGRVTSMAQGLTIANGLAWDLPRARFYHIDSPTLCVFVWDYDHAAGTIRNRRVAIRATPDDGLPDGMAMDSEGKLWVAHWGGSQVVRWDPDTGAALMRIRMPVSQPTSCAFGGDDFDRLYITSARSGLTPEQLSQQPLAGGLFVADPGVKGMPTTAFSG